MLFESFKFAEGIHQWERSLQLRESPWAWRNLSVAMARKEDYDKAIEYMEKALKLEDNKIDKAFVEEYFDLLIKMEKFEKLWSFYQALPEERKNSDRILIQAGYAAVELLSLIHISWKRRARLARITPQNSDLKPLSPLMVKTNIF